MAPSANADGARWILLWRHVAAIFPRHAVRFYSTQACARRSTLLFRIRIYRRDFFRRSVLASRSTITFSRSSGRQFLRRPLLQGAFVIRRRDLMWIAYPLSQVIVLPRVLQDRFQALAWLRLLLLLVALLRLSRDLSLISEKLLVISNNNSNHIEDWLVEYSLGIKKSKLLFSTLILSFSTLLFSRETWHFLLPVDFPWVLWSQWNYYRQSGSLPGCPDPTSSSHSLYSHRC